MLSIYDANMESVSADVLESHILGCLPLCSIVVCASVSKFLCKPALRAIKTELRRLGNSVVHPCPFPKLEVLLSVFEHGNASLIVWFANQLRYPTVAIVCSDKQQGHDKKSRAIEEEEEETLPSLYGTPDETDSDIDGQVDNTAVIETTATGSETVMLLRPWIQRKMPSLPKKKVDSMVNDTIQICLQLAAYRDRLDILECIWQQHPSELLRKAFSATNAAAYAGHLRILQWAHKNQILYKPEDRLLDRIRLRDDTGEKDRYISRLKVPFAFLEDTMLRASIGGHLHIISWLYETVDCLLCPEICTTLVRIASTRGYTHILDWALEKGLKNYMKDSTWYSAALLGQKHVLEWACKQKFHFDTAKAAYQAVLNGQFTVARWLIEKHPSTPLDDGFKNTAVCVSAVDVGDLDALKWLYGIGCKWDINTVLMAIEEDRVDMLGWILEQDPREWDEHDYLVRKRASSKASLSTIQWLIQHGRLVWTDQETLGAIQSRGRRNPKDVEVLLWIHDNNTNPSDALLHAIGDSTRHVYPSKEYLSELNKQAEENVRERERLEPEIFITGRFFLWREARQCFRDRFMI